MGHRTKPVNMIVFRVIKSKIKSEGYRRVSVHKERPGSLEGPTTKPARIEDVEIKKISEIWGKKPRGLRFNDTDALIITLKTEDGKTIRDTFYLCLKPDGTFNANTVSRDSSRARRQRLVNFLRQYNLADNIKDYNLREGIEKWKGKGVSIIEVDGSGFISV